MEQLQVVSVLGSLVLIIGLLKAHRIVVREYVLPEVVPDEEFEE